MPDKTNPHLPPQWHPLPSSSTSSSPPIPSPGYAPPHIQPSPQYPPPFTTHPRTTPQPQAPQFHHYQPPQAHAQAPAYTQPPNNNAMTARHPVTAPFQVPRMPHPWPFPGANRTELQAGVGRGAGAQQVPIDPRLLGAGMQGEERRVGPAPPQEWSRRGWPGNGAGS